MISSDKLASALYSLHVVLNLVELRAISSSGGDPRTVAELLDWAEAMPFLIAQGGEDRTESFRNHLRGIAEQCPRLQRAVDAFEANRGFFG